MRLRGNELTGNLRKLRNIDFHYLYISPNIICVIKLRKIKWTGHVARMGREEICVHLKIVYKVLVVKTDGKMPL